MPHTQASHSGTVNSGQTLSGFALPATYTLTVLNGGTLVDATTSSFNDSILLYGSAAGTKLTGGFLVVESGGIATNTGATANGFIDVYKGGVSIDGIVSAAGAEFDYGSDSGSHVLSGGFLEVESGGLASDVTIDPGAFAAIYSSGLIASSTLHSGAQLQISAGGLVLSGYTVGSGAVVFVLPGQPVAATASDTVVAAGGAVVLVGGATLDGLTVNAGGHVVKAGVVVFDDSGQIDSAGNHLNNTVLTSAYEVVYSGGVVSNTVLTPGAQQIVSSGGTAIRSIVQSSDFFGGMAVQGLAVSTMVMSGGEQNVEGDNGAVARFTMVASGGKMTVSGGTSVSATIAAGGYADIGVDGIASGTVLNGGSQFVDQNARVYGTRIGFGGVQTVSANSIVYNTVISAGGEQDLNGRSRIGAQASGTVIGAGGIEVLRNGAIAMSSTVLKGGVQNDYLGIASGTVILDGGQLRIESGGGAADITIRAGGTIDYTNVAFATGATATVNERNVLMVQDGTTTLVLQLVGNYAGESFVVGRDHGGGTYVTVSAAAEAARVAAMGGEQLLHGAGNEDLATASVPAAGFLHAAPQPTVADLLMLPREV